MAYFRTHEQINAGIIGDPKIIMEKKVKKKYVYKRKPTGEAEVFAKIWKERKPYSQILGQFLGEYNVCFFAHVIPKAKNKYLEYKLNPQNIVLMTLSEHHRWDNARHKCTGKEWNWIKELEANLKEKYKSEFEK